MTARGCIGIHLYGSVPVSVHAYVCVQIHLYKLRVGVCACVHTCVCACISCGQAGVDGGETMGPEYVLDELSGVMGRTIRI